MSPKRFLKDHVTCPYCDEEDFDFWNYNNGCKYHCKKCGKLFRVFEETLIYYTTEGEE